MTDNVNHPAHYESGQFECIDVMLETQGVEKEKSYMEKNMKHKAVRVDNLMYKGCEPHWECVNCGEVVPFHCYTKAEFESRCCNCHKINCKECEQG